MIKLLLADDHEGIRKAVSGILKDDAEVRVIAEAGSFREIMDLVATVRPDVVLMDVHMGDKEKVKLSDLESCLVGCQLLAMSLWTDEETKVLANSLGAIALLDKAKLGTELLPFLKLRVPRRSAHA